MNGGATFIPSLRDETGRVGAVCTTGPTEAVARRAGCRPRSRRLKRGGLQIQSGAKAPHSKARAWFAHSKAVPMHRDRTPRREHGSRTPKRCRRTALQIRAATPGSSGSSGHQTSRVRLYSVVVYARGTGILENVLDKRLSLWYYIAQWLVGRRLLL